MNHDIGAMAKRLAKIGGRHGVIDDQRQAGAMGDLGERFEIGHRTAGIDQAFGENRLGPVGDRGLYRRRIVGVDETAMPIEFLKGTAELGD